jgi:hypothetical protein
VQTRHGLVHGFAARGCSTRLTWTRVGDRQVVSRIDQQIGGPTVPANQRWHALRRGSPPAQSPATGSGAADGRLGVLDAPIDLVP